MSLSLQFLGVGSAIASDLGNSNAVLRYDDAPFLLIDCGFDGLPRYQQLFDQALPSAVFITHCHFDHIGGLEQLYFQASLSQCRPKIFVPVPIIESLVNILGNACVAEGNETVWDVLDLVSVLDSFHLNGFKFEILPVNHHAPRSAYGLLLRGKFFYSGDTRPIPEILNHEIVQGEQIFHDCCLDGNPSHSGLNDIVNVYAQSTLDKIVAYHYHGAKDRLVFTQYGVRAAEPFEQFYFSANNRSEQPKKTLDLIERSA